MAVNQFIAHMYHELGVFKSVTRYSGDVTIPELGMPLLGKHSNIENGNFRVNPISKHKLDGGS